MNEVKFRSRNMSVEQFLTEVFGAVPAKIKISIEALKAYAAADIFDERDFVVFRAIENPADLESFILNPKTPNNDVKSFLQEYLSSNGISFNESALKSCTKNNVKILFENLFDFSATVEVENTPAASPVETEPETAAPTPAEIPPEEKISLSFGHMQAVLNGCTFEENENMDAPIFNLIERMPVTISSGFELRIPPSVQIYRGAVAIVSRNNQCKLAAFGSLKEFNGGTYLLLDARDIDYELFRGRSSFYVVVFPQTARDVFERGEIYSGKVYRVECTIKLQQLEKTESTLCIDFGTSNTTVGTYGVKNPRPNSDTEIAEIVEFLDETGDKPEMRKMLPTVVYVEDCSDPTRVKYLFGYDALKKVIAQDYTPVAQVFYEIKRWITTLDSIENVTDELGNQTEISHREIMQAYLEHVLNLAEQYFHRHFTKIHFTAPVKLKDSFIAEMHRMFNRDGRTVYESASSIDEGIAIIYDHISEKRRKGELNSTPKKVLIMDCGGGTTDLASCEYRLEKTGSIQKLEIVTKFENGDANFGGNNVTYRILQLLKIKLAARLQGSDESIQNLIEDEDSLLSKINYNHKYKQGKDDREIAYAKFNAVYEAAEKFIPTKFGIEQMQKRRGKLKRNFYYLWQMAEAYKIQFYRDMGFVSINFNDARDRKIGIPDDNKYYLFVKKTDGGELERLDNPMSGIEITNNDIHRLLCADIYALLRNVLAAYDDNEQELLNYDHYKLSGQSCKITLFNELLKEFIPGKYLRYDSGDASYKPDSSELKLSCIKGSIYYTRDTAFGEMEPHITMEAPQLIYDICRVDVDGNTKALLDSRDEKINVRVHVLPAETSQVRCVVLSKNGKRQNTVDFFIRKNSEREILETQLKNHITRNTGDETQEIGNSVTLDLRDINLDAVNSSVYAIFAVPSKMGYGFYVYCVRVSNATSARYHLTQEPEYYSFEDNELATFFDGSK